MGGLVWFSLAVATAQTPSKPLHIVVVGELEIQQAHDEIVNRLLELGYRATKKPGVYQAPSAWMGKVHLADDGTMRFTRPLVALKSSSQPQVVDGQSFTALRTSNPGIGSTGPSFYIGIGKKKQKAVSARVLRATSKQRQALRTTLLTKQSAEYASEIFDKLERLWDSGEPLTGSTSLTTPTEKIEHVLGFWASQPDDPVNNAIAQVVESWLEERLSENSGVQVSRYERLGVVFEAEASEP